MAVKESASITKESLAPKIVLDRLRQNLSDFPWWVLGMVLIFIATIVLVLTKPTYQQAFLFIGAGIKITIQTTIFAFGIAVVLGLVAGLGRISSNVFFKNLSTLYVELIRGVPMLVLIFFIAYVGVPAGVSLVNGLGKWFIGVGLSFLGTPLTGMQNNNVAMNVRAIIALSITYGAYLAEIFRAGIQSIGRGQTEAARAQGMSYWQAMRYIILPQAIKNVLPALGNDFVSMLKDTSLVSVLAVRDITQIAKLYTGTSFRYQESYTILAVLYLAMTVLLSTLVKFMEKRYQKDERS